MSVQRTLVCLNSLRCAVNNQVVYSSNRSVKKKVHIMTYDKIAHDMRCIYKIIL